MKNTAKAYQLQARLVALDWIKQHIWHIFIPACSPWENLSCLSQQKTVFTATSNLCHSHSRVVYWRGQHKCTSCNRNFLSQKIVQKHNSLRYSQLLILPACTTSLYSNPLLEAIFQGDDTSFCSEREHQKNIFPQNLQFMRFDILITVNFKVTSGADANSWYCTLFQNVGAF